jgi:hypothetical protein
MSAPETREESTAAFLDFYREDGRRVRLFESVMGAPILTTRPPSIVDQVIARVTTLQDFAGLVEVELRAIPDDLVNTPMNDRDSCEASP